MLKKTLAIVIIACLALTLLAGCVFKPESTPPDASSSKTTSFGTGSFPLTKEITVVREGFEEVFTGTLAVSNAFGYAVYLLPDYELRESGEIDFIAPKHESQLLPEINILVYEVDPNEPIPEPKGGYGITPMIDYRRFSMGDKTLEAKLNYPYEAADGGAMLLHAMVDTICQAG